MDEQEKIEFLRAMTGEQDETTLSAYLAISGRKVLNRAYPFGTDKLDVPERYEHVQLNVAAYLLNKRGAEGETMHSEGGVSRSYENGDVPDSMLRDVTPMCGIPGGRQ